MKSLVSRPSPWSRVQKSSKRAFDIMLSGAGLVFSSPIWLMVAISIVAEDGLPIFFCQNRWGRGRTIFSALKFRTMWKIAGSMRSVQAGQEDPRITKVGRFLRACAMDELPQLWNIFRGDMSFVGPRALPINEIQSGSEENDVPDESVRGFKERLSVRPGLTGIAQVFADRDTTREKKFRYDNFYIRRQEFGLDLRLIFLSFYISFLGRWEVRGGKLKQRRTRSV